jgi:RNA polymerase sigma factor (TIGR02999 family)
MPSRLPGTVTRLLEELGKGHEQALGELVPLVYVELRAVAGRALRRERKEHTLDTAALVNEAYLRLAERPALELADRQHFLGIAARMMREVLVDHARRRQAKKRGGAHGRITLGDLPAATGGSAVDLGELHESLARLEQFDAGLARLVELRFFAGRTIEETAEVLGTSPATVKRDWAVAKAWLKRDIDRARSGPGPPRPARAAPAGS